MASIYRRFTIAAPAKFVWDAVRDWGAVHQRLAQGFVVSTAVVGNTRTVTFANGFIVKENIVAIDDTNHRLVYSAVGGRASHHNASMQVSELSPTESEVLWITDLQPDELAPALEGMMEQGIRAMQLTLARARSH